MKKNNGFTLIELMIVIAIIGILIGTTFKLMQVAVEAKARSVTIARMERLQNALSGYYATYGMYPAVPLYGDPDPASSKNTSETDGNPIGSDTWESALAAARAQPIGFEYPTPKWMDAKIPLIFYPQNVISVNNAIGSLSPTDDDWNKYKGFKFGLLSFLLPRVQIVGHPDEGDKAPLPDVYEKAQWKSNNLNSNLLNLEKQRLLENEACMRWLPCFEGILRSFVPKVILKDADQKITAEVVINGDPGGGSGMIMRQMQGGPAVALGFITIADGWGSEFFYHSAPPYQSFQVWSAGPDGLTFPPWVPIPSSGGMKAAKDWVKDDIVGGKMQM